MSKGYVVAVSFQSIKKATCRLSRPTLAAALLLSLFGLVRPASATQLVLSSSGGTMTLGSHFMLTNANVSNPAGTLSIDCPITSIASGTYQITYACSGGSFNFQSADGSTTVTGPFTSGDLYLTASGGGRGGNIKHYYQFYGNLSGVQTVSGQSAAIIGETRAVIGPLTSQVGSGSAPAGPGSTGINSTYSPIYVSNYSFSQLVRSDDIFGTNELVFGSTGTHTNQFYGPHGVTADAAGRLYVVDTYNCRIVRVDDITGKNWNTLGTCGTGVKQFTGATDIALDSAGRIYVADAGNSRIVRFDDMAGTNWIAFGTAGTGVNQLSGASGIAVDPAGKIYIADTGNKRLVRVDDMIGTNWTTLTQSPVIGIYIYSFGSPAHVALDNVGRILVGDGNQVIRVDDMAGTNWSALNVGTTVEGLTVASDGTTYVAGSTSSSGYGVALFDDVTTGGGFFGTNLVGNAGGIYAVPVPTPVPAVKLSAGSLTFAKQNTGTTSASQSVTLTNFGGAPLNNAIAVTGDFVSTNDCPPALAGGYSCTITVSYAPTITGPESGAVTISDNAFTGTQSIALSGVGTAPVAGVAPASVTFQPQLINTTSSGQLVILSNTGTGPLTFSGSGISASGDFAQINNCGSEVLPLTSCQITITFTPSVAGPESGFLYVTDNAGTQTVSLAGTGANAAPTITVSPESLVFPEQLLKTKSASQPVVFSNRGAAAVSITSIGISGDFLKSGTCPLTLGAGKSCTQNITFAPTSAGTRTGTLTYTLSSGSVIVALSGTGTSTATGWLTISPNPVSFNNDYVVGDNPDQIVTITNTNGVPVGITHLGLSGSTMFTQTNNCPKVLGAYASCSVDITFTPTAAGTFSGTLTVTESAGTVHKVPVSGIAYLNGG